MLKKTAIIVGVVALAAALPVLAEHAFAQKKSHVQIVRVCLQTALNRYQEGSESARTAYLNRLEDLKKIQRLALQTAWNKREAIVKSGRVSIVKAGGTADVKAERTVFEAAKAQAEADYAAAKKSAADARHAGMQTAKEDWTKDQASLRQDYLAAKEACRK